MAVTTPSWGPEGRKRRTWDPASSPVAPSPSREVGPSVPSLGVGFLAAQPTGARWPRAPAGARRSGSRGHVWKTFGRAPQDPDTHSRGRKAAADKRLLPARIWDLSCGPQTNSPDSQGWGNRASSRSRTMAEPGMSARKATSEASQGRPGPAAHTCPSVRPHEAHVPRAPVIRPMTNFTARKGLSRP